MGAHLVDRVHAELEAQGWTLRGGRSLDGGGGSGVPGLGAMHSGGEVAGGADRGLVRSVRGTARMAPPAKSVLSWPGSTVMACGPNGATSCAGASVSPSIGNFDAEQGPNPTEKT